MRLQVASRSDQEQIKLYLCSNNDITKEFFFNQEALIELPSGLCAGVNFISGVNFLLFRYSYLSQQVPLQNDVISNADGALKAAQSSYS